MLDENFEGFIFRYPLWILLHPTAVGKNLINTRGSQGQKAVPIFTDRDLAERIRDSDPRLATQEAVPLGPEGFIAVLETMEQTGFTHVAFDYRGVGLGCVEAPVARLLPYLRKLHGKQTGGEAPAGTD